MFKLQSKGVICGAGLAAVFFATPMFAQDRTALVIANSAYPGDAALPDVRGAALKVSETLLGLGFTVNRLENPSAADMQTAVASAQAGDGVSLIYYAGRTTIVENESLLMPVAADGNVPIAPLVSGTADSTRFVFLDMCHDVVEAAAEIEDVQNLEVLETEDVAIDLELPLDPSLSVAIGTAEDLFFAASVEPGQACAFIDGETLTDVLLDRMTVPGLPADQIDPNLQDDVQEAEAGASEIWFGSTLSDPFVFRTATNDVRLTAEDYAMLDRLSPEARDQMLRLWASAGIAIDIAGAQAVTSTPIAPAAPTNSTVVLVAPVSPVAAATVISPISPRASTGAGTTIQPVTNGVTLVAGGGAAPAPAVFRATPGENGLPAPSILVGFITNDEDVVVAPEVDDGPVAGSGLSYDDLDARNAMRKQDAVLFASLVESGAFDPPDAEMARAIQTELARMNCYRSTIDGIWGPGSRRSVTGYYEVAGGTIPSQDPVAEIFRQIIANDDIRCPDPVVVPQAAAAPRRATTTQAAPRRAATQQAAPAAPAPAPAAPAAPARRTISQSSGTGAFR